ncbi:MAG: hypothetical protein IJ370_05640 [Oscillospiraceae bacterium]|nr:hypothetical protein [Oscillospiraceae bacterium]
METSTLYYLMRLYDLYTAFGEKQGKSFSELYSEINSHTSKDILFNVPEVVKVSAEKLCLKSEQNEIKEFCELLKPYADECRSLLPDLTDANEKFSAIFTENLREQGYFVKGGAFRKVRKNRLYLIEAELSAAFKADDWGFVTAIEVSPVVRCAEAKVKLKKDKRYYTECGLIDDEVTFSDLKYFCPSTFYKTLKHLDKVELGLEGGEVSDEDVSVLASSALVAPAVCENRAIPSYYKKLCKNDFPIGKAFSVSLMSGLCCFVLTALILGVISGIGVYIALGYEKIFGLFMQPWFYLFVAAISVIYSVVVFTKTRRGRF